ncbi:hypothetical protein EPA93_39005 [Ktedonosporobacter rubrisoli]|uniref:HTH luxR-type domain-containing protein n=1 Tax=Ktedonosporobacter rubrisoli TaxID=2509675 RepID=A0A4P6K1C9_KTERU|nr:LuxR C-terminal-related transcriptional regulator [Ktedonosporobacter rubrisoli]QBD81643.1 hypothetical protein EPA93_39005 [Ktedonosporobacter rubrisoli]
MARTTPQLSNGMLTVRTGTKVLSIHVGSEAWWRWLENAANTTFHFSEQELSFTARHEYKSGSWYWYAYRKQHKKLRKAYLGKSRELTAERLENIAVQLMQRADQPAFARVRASDRDQDSQALAGADTTSAVERTNYPHGLPAHLQGSSLLSTKLMPPPLRAELVARPHLISQCENCTRYKLTLVCAPAGFGKSTLLRAWQISSRCSNAWLSLDSGDNDPERFWAYMLAAMQKLYPAPERELRPEAFPLLSTEAFLVEVINTLASLTHDCVLILDDYHVITNQAIHDALLFLLDHLPARFHLLIASRSDPPWPLVRLRAQGQLYEFRTADLRFSPQEMAAFLKQVMGLHLSSDELSTLDAHIEGWVAGLQLAALSMQGHKNVREVFATFTGSHRYVIDYLTGEVLQRLPEHRRNFLLQTSILERLSTELCNAITGRLDSQEMLEWLEQANLFLIPLDEERHWYRYHHLFAEFLQSRLRQEHSDLLPQLHRRAAEWYKSKGIISPTIEHALAGGDFYYAAEMMELYTEIMLQRGEVMTSQLWLQALPEEVLRTHPHLRIHQIGTLISIGQLDMAEAYLQDIEASIVALSDEHERSRRLKCEFFAARTALFAFRGELAPTLSFAQQALTYLPEGETLIYSFITISQAAAYLFSGELTKASQAFAEIASASYAQQNPYIILVSISCQSYLQIIYGQLHKAVETCQRALRLGTRPGGKVFATTGISCVYLSQVYYEWNRLEEAERYARDGIEIGKRWGYIGGLGLGYCNLAYTLRARGKVTEALALLKQAEAQAHQYSLFLITSLLASYRARLHLISGDTEAAIQWAKTCGLDSSNATFTYPHELAYVVLARVYMVMGRLSDAEQLIGRLLPAAEAGGRVHTLLECLTVQTLLQLVQGQLDQALKTLARALTLGEPEGYIRVFVDNGKPMAHLLQQAAARGISPRYIHKLLAAYAETEGKTQLHLSGLLSERELAILQSIAAGQSNQEIAREHVIALSTVKTHLNNIYTKLGVHSRTQAIVRARELDLLRQPPGLE